MKWLCILFFLTIIFSFAQEKTPVDYLQEINQDQEAILDQTWNYLNSVARSGSQVYSKSQKYRIKETIEKSIDRIKTLEEYKGSSRYRDSMISYLEFSRDVITGRTKKMIDLEQLSQDSFDAMESYILYKKELGELLKKKNRMISTQQKFFAKKHNVTLVQHKNELIDKIEKATKAFNYKDAMYLSFFRCSIYEDFMLNAFQIEEKNANYQYIALNVSNLADESRENMDTIQDINSDLSLRIATENGLRFFEREAQELSHSVTNYNRLRNEYSAMRESFEKLETERKTEEKVNELNDWVKRLNTESKKLDKLYQKYNQERSQIYNNWNQIAHNFIQKSVPE